MEKISSSLNSTKASWKIDDLLKIHLVYLQEDPSVFQDTEQYLVPLLKNVKETEPDINNIIYDRIYHMGFPLPQRDGAESLKLFLKLYKWPVQFNNVKSADKIFNSFLLYDVPGADQLYSYIQEPSNIYLKYAFIDKDTRNFAESEPLNTPLVPDQSVLDKQIPFSSIYILPDKVNNEGCQSKKVKTSTQGVMVFHQSISAVYQKKLWNFYNGEGKRFFIDLRMSPEHNEFIAGVNVFELPEKPLDFYGTYLKRPMPQDPKNIFLTSLLLIKFTEYTVSHPIPLKMIDDAIKSGIEELKSKFQKGWSHMLEVGSVVDLR